MEDWQNAGFGLYIHWPFCQAKCPYCDFNSHVSHSVDQSQWLIAYLSEIDRVKELTGKRVLNTVFFGGGTPSLMDPEIVHKILSHVHQSWPCANDLEVTLEANPSSVEAGRFQGYSQAGVNRISMGIQALNDADLRNLGRMHTVKEAQDAFDIARGVFDRVSFDLIYARQNQTLADWETELQTALDMAVDHLSLYQLTVEDGTAFGDRYARGRLRGLPTDDLSADMYDLTADLSGAAGFEAYEVSNHAPPGAESRHNLIYWRYGDYAGIGPGAHSRLTNGTTRRATEAKRTPEIWLAAASSGQTELDSVVIASQDQANEYLMMGMRLQSGIDLNRYNALSGMPLNANVLDHLEDINMIERTHSHLRATKSGRMVLNAVLKELLVGP
ncbi:MAG: radical SAM family heme chaperone HemW [Paracoccaceae bacterium]|nr:radical SAM family heme chaperone HemW [Paracoccaceae bacterium]